MQEAYIWVHVPCCLQYRCVLYLVCLHDEFWQEATSAVPQKSCKRDCEDSGDPKAPKIRRQNQQAELSTTSSEHLQTPKKDETSAAAAAAAAQASSSSSDGEASEHSPAPSPPTAAKASLAKGEGAKACGDDGCAGLDLGGLALAAVLVKRSLRCQSHRAPPSPRTPHEFFSRSKG